MKYEMRVRRGCGSEDGVCAEAGRAVITRGVAAPRYEICPRATVAFIILSSLFYISGKTPARPPPNILTHRHMKQHICILCLCVSVKQS